MFTFVIGFVLVLIFLYASKKFYWSGTHCPSQDRMDDKIVVITGSNTGIGKHTAIELAKRGARIILACRSRQRAEEARQEIISKSNNNQIDIEIIDTSSLQSVRECAARLRKSLPRIDVLINNAGMLTQSKEKSVDGYEIHLATNHLGHFLFTNLLLDLLEKAPSARVINVSALAHAFFNCHIHWDDINLEKTPCSAFYAYSCSKFANVMFTNELAKRLKGTRITTNSLHPGIVHTEFGRYYGGRYQIIFELFHQLLSPLLWFFLKSSEEGAQTTIYLASDIHLDNVTGKYFSDCLEVQPSPLTFNEEDNQRFWLLSEQMTKLNDNFKEQ
ncbi:unnamed protein product [Rotaria socialis]|uniref:Retinol dehydrogenase 11 n=2 Tax=Rotaria socialis TaxID=392032 RepID=A0A817W4R6_9BILA|nr:unnamed protein product [Rotaria socialis]CAF3483206.1 unnamed protein product [Rotaria socialis]CAF3535524.1 unnamed protein product [Rotaria socialis]CAF3560531.1 unnamed protein product [Rotaria socialis]CAF4464624.1 unnamed protein product [Rotaria socialis]